MRGQLPDLTRLISELQAQGGSLAIQCADAVRPYAPVGKGQSRPAGTFRDSLTGRAEAVSAGLVITVESDDAPVADIVLHGSRPHEIVARNAGSLRWESDGGGIRFAKRVHHPGTQANDFGTQAEADLTAICEAAVDRALEAVIA